ncbi:MAG: hypothetical protein GTO45_28995 [Candidatus Aminicenantes bacterium]|nr:hypothetical protein [Candidatus Aminicenantes bacterium]NIM82829.1 hypothetical protein [Candidatus Aminicenantes bacterium]NIN22205.1 hypothetical protein [Candidatus Aminicenantes bacterium]NIN45973.1 hypothetical protein [Candidatus Aminicenantes bacterium]NIN88809.1 hypothetical protein [Candidatus Aminicenantes bacterium]
MSKEQLKKLINGILAERRDRVYERMDQVTNNIIIQLENLKELGDFQEYSIPEDFELYEKPKEGTTINILHRYIRKLSFSANQLDLINNFLEGVNQFCTRAALFLLREDKLVGWKGKGFSAVEGAIGDEEIKKIFFSLSANTIFRYVLEKQKSYSGRPTSQADDHIIYSRFGGPIPKKIFTLPFFVKGKPQAVIYTDTFAGKPIGEKEIEMIATVGEMSLDLLPLRQKILAKIKTREYPEEEEEAPSEQPDADDLTVASVKENDPERLARVIVNDIYLYNKNKVDDALNTGENLYEALQNTIMQSRELYLNKFTDLSPFEKQLVDTLARGRRELLKGYHFEKI